MANPTEAYPSSAAIAALNATTDAATGLEYIPLNTGAGSSPSLIERIDRRADRANKLVAPLDLRVCRVDDTHIGCYAGVYRLAGTDYTYAGEASVVANPSGDDTYYVYLTSSGAIDVVTDAVGWPADATTFIPLAEVVVASGAITTITDVRGRVVLSTPSAAVVGSGTTDVAFTIDSDNGGAGADTELRFNRGTTAGDAAIKATGASGAIEALADRDTGVRAGFGAKTIDLNEDTNAPISVASSTKVANLNVDQVDGIDFADGGSLDPGGVPYASNVAEITTTAAGTAGDVLLSGGAGAPTWSTPGSAGAAIQPYDADLTALAGVAAAGLLARTGAGTAAARTVTAGTLMTVTDGDGVAGNPVVALAQGTSNTVVCGNTSAPSVYRQIVDADISNSGDINGAKFKANSIESSKLRGGNDDYEMHRFLRNFSGDSSAPQFLPLFPITNYASSGTPSFLDLAHSCVTNTGATGLVTLTLSGAPIAENMTMVRCTDADGIKLIVPSGCKVRDGTTLSANNGYIQSTEVGAVVTLQTNYEETEVWVVSKIGTWSVA